MTFCTITRLRYHQRPASFCESEASSAKSELLPQDDCPRDPSSFLPLFLRFSVAFAAFSIYHRTTLQPGIFNLKMPCRELQASMTCQVFPRMFLLRWITVVLMMLSLFLFFQLYETKSPLFISSTSDIAELGLEAPLGSQLRNKSKIAIVTFLTHPTSYTHLSLKNKARKLLWVPSH